MQEILDLQAIGAFSHPKLGERKLKISIDNFSYLKELADDFIGIFDDEYVERLKAAHTLAVDNGDCLFIDTYGVDDVCFWHHDGGDIEIISSDIDIFESEVLRLTVTEK